MGIPDLLAAILACCEATLAALILNTAKLEEIRVQLVAQQAVLLGLRVDVQDVQTAVVGLQVEVDENTTAIEQLNTDLSARLTVIEAQLAVIQGTTEGVLGELEGQDIRRFPIGTTGVPVPSAP